jgi:uncharacterized protein YjgD (DUF1641 family)
MSAAKLLKNLNRRVIALTQINPETNKPLTVTIRKVKQGEVIARSGMPMSLINLAKAGPENEAKEERTKRMMERIKTPEGRDEFMQAMQTGLKMRRATLCLGIVSDKVVDKPENELLEDEVTPEIFGDDQDLIYNAICDFSNLPFGRAEVADLETFPDGRGSVSGTPLESVN